MIAPEIIKLLEKNDFQISHSSPVTHLTGTIITLNEYFPYKEENRLLKSVYLRKLNTWKKELIVGGAKE